MSKPNIPENVIIRNSDNYKRPVYGGGGGSGNFYMRPDKCIQLGKTKRGNRVVIINGKDKFECFDANQVLKNRF